MVTSFVDIDVEDARKFREIRERLKTAERDIRLSFLREVRKAVSPLKGEVRASALDKLPRRGGLAEKIAASRYSIRVGTRAVVFQTKGLHDIRAIDKGKVRHPVFGDKDLWVNQAVPAGFWTAPITASGPRVREAVRKLVDDAADKFERGS